MAKSNIEGGIYMMGGYGYGGYGGFGGGYGWMSMIMPIIFGIGIILLGLYIVRRNSTQVHTDETSKHNSGLDILRERYARGEIDSAEYQSRKQDLEGK